jgi:flagellar motor switch protein FliG
MTTKLSNDGLRKAAILVASLDTAAADAVLDQLTPNQARQVREIVIELDNIDEKEQRCIIDEFFRREPAAPQHDGGVELDGRLAWLASRADTHAFEEPHLPASPPAPPFRFLQETETNELVRALASERPQTIALVLSHMSPAKSGAVLGRLPEKVQVEVVHRLVDLEETDPEILREIEEVLRGRLARHVDTQRRDPQAGTPARLQAVAGILHATDGRTGIRILDNLASHDRTLAEKLLPRQMDFDDLADLDNDTLAETFDEAGPELMLPALLGASPEVVDRFLDCLPTSDARALYYKLNHPEPIRLRDMEEARRQVARIASRFSYQIRSQELGVRT